MVVYQYLEHKFQLKIIRFCQFSAHYLPVAKQVTDLKKVITGNLKFSHTRWALMVEYSSITPGKMFLNSDLHKNNYKQSKLTKQMHGWDGLFVLTFHVRMFWLWNLEVVHLIECHTQFARVGEPWFEATVFCYSKLHRCSVQGQVVNLALQLCTRCDFKHADSFRRIAFTWLPILTH